MSIESALQLVPTFVLAFFRIAGMLLAAPLFSGSRIPRRIKLYFALVLAAAMTPTIRVQAILPESSWLLAAGIAGEMLFGLAIGAALNLVFVAVSWAGDIIGQQMGLSIGSALDPQFGQSTSVVGDLHFFLTLVIFLILRGHHAFLRGVHSTFDSLPLLSVGMSRGLLDIVVGLMQSATVLALHLSAPMIVAMLATDLVLGFLNRTVPQINVLTAGLPLRAVLGMVVLVGGLSLASQVIGDSMVDSVEELGRAFAGLTRG